MARRGLALSLLAAAAIGCGPRGAGLLPAVPRGAVFAGGQAVVELPGPCSRHVVGGSGRFLVCQLAEQDELVVVDVARAKIVKRIAEVPPGALLAAGADKLVIVRPAYRMLERWSLWDLRREQVGALPTYESPRVAAMGCGGNGPLLLATAREAVLVDLETLKPQAIEGTVIGATGRYGCVVDVSADGRTFTSIPTGYGAVSYSLMTLQGKRARGGSFGSTSHAVRWARPSADGTILFLPGGKLYAASLREVPAERLEGATCFPSPDPGFFLAVRFVEDKARTKHLTEARICTTADRRVVHTIKGLDEMAPAGNTSARHAVARRLADHEPRFFYFPAVKALVTLPYDSRRIFLRGLDLAAELDASGRDYLFITSVPPAVLRAGERLRYQIAAVSKAGGVEFRLESGPPGAGVSRRGLVTWQIPRQAGPDWVTIIVSVRDRGGREVFHTLYARVVGAFRRKRY